MSKIAPLKRFGQNYLVDKNVITKIIEEFNPQPNEIILEIGPGQGALTEELIKSGAKIYAVEIDFRVIEELQMKFPLLTILNMDFLKTDIFQFIKTDQKIRIIGNIPYNITSPIVFKLLDEREKIKDAVLMVQYEVAKRFAAKPNSKEYGIPTVFLDYYTKTEFCFKVPSTVFYPKPKVDSAIIHINFLESQRDKEFEEIYSKVVKASFGNRRKTLKNSLSNSIFRGINFGGSPIDLSRRAETLSYTEYITLTNFIFGKLHGGE
ncbi:dimethyladenosine transferase [bacterium BRH_c32]|nr:MAG: dimethyladenosine transferase [bacterium BRH_c32]